MKHTFYATRELTVNGKTIEAGALVGTIETDLPLERFVASLGNGAASADRPAEKSRGEKPAK